MFVFRLGNTLYKHFITTGGVQILFLQNKKVTPTHAVFFLAICHLLAAFYWFFALLIFDTIGGLLVFNQLNSISAEMFLIPQSSQAIPKSDD